MKRLIIGTSNAGKIIEIRSGLGDIPGWTQEPLPAGISDIEETGTTFMANAIAKAEHYSKIVPELTLADDSGLCVAALDLRPGVHSARYAPSPQARIEKLLGEMKSVSEDRRQAVFYCALALAREGQILWTTQGEVAGIIAHEAAGIGGFGYDPVFLLPELNRTMAQLSTEDKNRLSARGKALLKLRNFLLSNPSLT